MPSPFAPVLEPAIFQRDFFAALAGRGPDGAFDVPGLAVHRNTGARALHAALADNYPVVRRLFGEEAFGACAANFVAEHPPRDPRLSHYGEPFAAFLHDYAPARDHAWIADVAALERLWLESLFAADAAVADSAIIGDGIDAETRLALHPATRCALFDSPAASIWLAHQDDHPSLDTLDWTAEAVLVTRPLGEVMIAPIDRATLAFVKEIAAGQPVLSAAEAAVCADPEHDLADLFADLIEAGAFLSSRS